MSLVLWIHSAKRFLHDESGSTFALVGLSIVLLMGSVGAGIDMGRAQMVQTKLSQSLESAGLAAGATVTTQNSTAVANTYFLTNFNGSPNATKNYMGVTLHPISVQSNADNTVLTLSISADVPTTFMQMAGITKIPVKAEAEITRANKGMELVLVMDNTGSMTQTAGGGVSKLQASKNAAINLVNILYGNKTTVDNLWIGLVPFAQAVNIGSARSSWTANTTFNWGTTSWMGCVDARETSNRDVTDDPPSVARFPKYYWPCHTTNNAWYGTNSSRNNCQTSGTIRYQTLSTSLGPNMSCSQVITPMTANKTAIINGINSMQAVGNTHIVLGASWGWRMLSPRWKTLWGGEMNTAQLPQDYNTPLMNKVVILMTDGDNTIDNSNRGGYGYLSEGKLGTTNSTNAVTQLNTRLLTTCTNMKNNGILIYTIALGTGITNSAQNMLRACASKTDYYFNSPTASDLQTAFHTIADSLANLRISK